MDKCPNCGRGLLGLAADHAQVCAFRAKTAVPLRVSAISQIRSRPVGRPVDLAHARAARQTVDEVAAELTETLLARGIAVLDAS